MKKPLINRGKELEDIANEHSASLEASKLQAIKDSYGRGLVYAINDGTDNNEGKIYFYIDGVNDILLAQRKCDVNALCFHNGKLYDASDKGYGHAISETLTDQAVAFRDKTIQRLVSHKGDMYDVGDYDSIFKTLSTAKHIVSGPESEDDYDEDGEPIETEETERGGCRVAIHEDEGEGITQFCAHEDDIYYNPECGTMGVLSGEVLIDEIFVDLCSHKGQLYGASSDYIRNITTDSEVTGTRVDDEDSPQYYSLCSHKEKLYAVDGNGELYFVKPGIKRRIGKREVNTDLVESINGVMYDVGRTGIYDTLKDQVLFSEKEKKVTAICGVDEKTINKIMKDAKITNK